MGIVQTPFWSIECNGPAPTPQYRHCPTVAKGDWDQATVEANAIAAGWVANGPKWLCPLCVPIVEVPKVKPVRQPKVADTPADQVQQ